MKQRLDLLQNKRLHPKFCDIEFFLVKETEGDAFAFDGGNCSDTNVDGGAFELQVNPSVLGHTSLRDVKAGHDFQTRDHRALQRFDIFWHRDFDEAAIDTVADA